MDQNQEKSPYLKIHQYLILGSLVPYSKGIQYQKFFTRLSSLFPAYFRNKKTFYYHIECLVKKDWIETISAHSLPPKKL